MYEVVTQIKSPVTMCKRVLEMTLVYLSDYSALTSFTAPIDWSSGSGDDGDCGQ